MSKRGILERALLPLYEKAAIKPRLDEVATQLAFAAFFTLLEKQAIVIDGRVEQHTCCTKKHEHTAQCGWDTIISLAIQTFFGDTIRQIGLRGKHGTPGKYLFIGVPLEEKE